MAGSKKKKVVSTTKVVLPPRITSRGSQARVPEASQAEKLLAYWQEEIKALSSEVFASEEAALNTLMDRVLTRLTMPEHLIAPTREFLETLFVTDPTLMDTIRKTMKIKSV